VWTLRGPVVYYVLFFIHIHTRRVHIVGMTPNPEGPWMAQQARNMSMVFADEPDEHRPTHIIRDRDSKFTNQFCSIIEDDGIEFREIAPLSANMNAHLERFCRSLKEECLERMILFSESSLRKAVREFLAHYHKERHHQGLGKRLIETGHETGRVGGEVQCRKRLGGLLRYYHYREVA
jgi:putative transposase